MILLLLWSCAPTELEFSTEVLGCENFDFSAEENGESQLKIETDKGLDLLVSRTFVYQNADAIFSPTYEIDDYKVYIREFWETEDDSFQVCFQPIVRVLNSADLSLEFWWYIGNEAISFDLVQSNL